MCEVDRDGNVVIGVSLQDGTLVSVGVPYWVAQRFFCGYVLQAGTLFELLDHMSFLIDHPSSSVAGLGTNGRACECSDE